MNSVYSYLGYEYRPWDDVEEDNIKTYHECYKHGQRVDMPHEFYNHSPYSLMTFEEFVGYVQTVEVFIQG
jgi:uncharacterized protein YacL (UPF0231 family)